ncbi:hypothetical protein GIB67_013289 [Kingdonia uniflora]|uniref:Uncharacterized protein n=1 Tax=Kingdonia uniflora TaxID=39325 RepID=A0A7J7N6A1_9MAGN|nr:hypothetical protein GIB67_013289 [Kingdonia uniflora]
MGNHKNAGFGVVSRNHFVVFLGVLTMGLGVTTTLAAVCEAVIQDFFTIGGKQISLLIRLQKRGTFSPLGYLSAGDLTLFLKLRIPELSIPN